MKTKNFKTIEQVIKEGNSITNQKIKEKFVGREIYCNVGSLVEYILRAGFEDRNAPFTIDDIENLYSYPEYRGTIANFEGGTEDERQAEIDRLRDLAEGDNDNTAKIDFNDLGILEAEIEELEDLKKQLSKQEYFQVLDYMSMVEDNFEDESVTIVST